MISSSEYNLLLRIKNKEIIKFSNYKSELEALERKKFITLSTSNRSPFTLVYDHISLTEAGKAAMEEYERTLESLQNEKESVQIAREANDIAKKANKKSSVANWIAIAAAIFSLGMLIVTILK